MQLHELASLYTTAGSAARQATLTFAEATVGKARSEKKNLT